MNREELSINDGRDGRKAYVAVNGTIYDFTGSALWQNGDHQGAHQAGTDLTEALQEAPHVRAVIERFPVIGRLEETAVEPRRRSRWGLLIGFIVAALAACALVAAMM